MHTSLNILTKPRNYLSVCSKNDDKETLKNIQLMYGGWVARDPPFVKIFNFKVYLSNSF